MADRDRGHRRVAWIVAGGFSHLGRVRLIAGHIDKAALAHRQRRQLEIPLEANEAFDLLDAAIRELPRIAQCERTRQRLRGADLRPESPAWSPPARGRFQAFAFNPRTSAA